MSLTTFLKNPDVKAEFARRLSKPRFALQKELLAPPLTKHYPLVGTAFDYLMRFYLKHLNPSAVAKKWVAESSVDRIPSTEGDLLRTALEIVHEAKAAYSDFLSSGEMTDKVIESALLLAQLDPIVRAGFIDRNIGTVHEQDVADLRNLISIVDPGAFRAKALCMLNPTFGEGSRLVGGADADLLIDDALIDIKTTQSLRLTRDYLNQLIGYYILSMIGGVDNAPHAPRIERIGIYYSRYAELYTVPVRTVVDEERLPSFIEWFKQRAARECESP